MKKVALMLVGILVLSFLFGACSDQTGMEQSFQSDRESLIAVKDYLVQVLYEDIYISVTMNDGEMSCDGELVSIEEKELVTALKALQMHGYHVIGKEKGDTIYFQKKSDLDSGEGFAYTIEGSKPKLQFLVETESLDEPNWYYYKEDYNEWERENMTNGIPNYVLGTWKLRHAEKLTAGEYPIQTERQLVFHSDGNFSQIDGVAERSGEYELSYENKIKLTYQDGTKRTVQYLPDTDELVYYNAQEIAQDEYINEYYVKIESQ